MGDSKGAKLEVTHHDGVSVVRVDGVIDELFDAAALAGHFVGRAQHVVVDLDAVPRITSFGVRQWLDGLRALATEQLYFVRARPAMVAQFNSVPQFGGKGTIVSFYCPYVCPECDTSFETLLDVRTHRDALRTQTAPPAKCPKCGAEAEFDDLEQSYFRRAAAAPPSSLPVAVEAAIDGRPVTAKRAFRVAKHVDVAVTALWLTGRLDRSARLRRYAEGLEGQVILFVLRGVDGVTPDGYARLKEAIAVAPTAMLARAPLALAPLLAADEDSPKVLSVEQSVRCDKCNDVRFLDVSNCTAGPPVAPKCPVCGNAVDARWPAGASAALSSITLLEAPPAAKEYLAQHPAFSDDVEDAHTGTAPTPSGGTVAVLRAAPGQRFGKYEVVQRIGMGGMAEILLGKQLGPEGFEKKVVIKRILPHLASQPSFVGMFTQEARVAARLAHRNIVQIYDLCREGDEFFIVMEYVRGLDLNTVIKLAGRLDEDLPIEVACRVAADVAAALDAAHTYVGDDGTPSPVLHRDVTPHNILVGRDGQVRLTDFGVAKAADSLQQTGTGVLKGKVMYMAPEHVRSGVSDPRIDVFALGLVLYLCLTREHPFRGSSEIESLKKVLDEPIRPVAELRPAVPDVLARIVTRAIDRDPQTRYQSARELQADLETFLATFGAPASPSAVAMWLDQFLSQALALPAPAPVAPGDATQTTPEKVARLKATGTEDDTVLFGLESDE